MEYTKFWAWDWCDHKEVGVGIVHLYILPPYMTMAESCSYSGKIPATVAEWMSWLNSVHFPILRYYEEIWQIPKSTYDCDCAGRRVTLQTRYLRFIAPQCVISTFRPTNIERNMEVESTGFEWGKTLQTSVKSMAAHCHQQQIRCKSMHMYECVQVSMSI